MEEAKFDQAEWLNSKEVMEALKISSCDLMHLREKGEMHFKKVGNSFYYNCSDIIKCITLRNGTETKQG
ncbi:MAG: hypothetical protein JWO44_2781 [Bacteroidetes bacterium]|nr:hypothetical protein [Bacteroidota bacterium]